MAIRFPCPSCEQPIEVDDDWGNQSVACPYCRRVVNAPAASTWPPHDIPVAAPAQSAFAPPLPPSQHGDSHAGQPFPADTLPPHAPPVSGTSKAGAALALSIASAVLSIIGCVIWYIMIIQMVIGRIGSDASEDQFFEEYMKILSSKTAPIHPVPVALLVVGTLCGMAGLVLAVRSLLRRERRQVMALVACIIATCFVLCQILMMMAMASMHSGPT